MFVISMFLVDRSLWVHCLPEQPRQNVAPRPGDAIISQNEIELSSGRCGIVIRQSSALGQFLSQLNTVQS